MRDLKQVLILDSATIKDAIKSIDNSGMKMAIVVNDNNELVGILTDGDIRRAILCGTNVDENISNYMTTTPLYSNKNESHEKITRLILDNSITGLPILDDSCKVCDFAYLDRDNKLRYFNTESVNTPNLSTILVIGGGGYIGSVLVRKLLKKGYKVTVLDKFIYGKESLLEIQSDHSLRIIEGDTRHIEDVTLAIKDADAVVHLAELVGDPACALNPSLTQEINYLATKMVGEVCKRYQINRLVYASSCSVYGASKNDELLNEDSSLCPVSLYAKMKIASEQALKRMENDVFSPTILRLSTVFGISPRPRFDLVVNTLTAKATVENKITIFGGDQWRPNVHVGDVANTIISVLEAPLELVGGQIFNVGVEENNYTINQIGELIQKEIPTAKIQLENNSIDKRDYKVNFSKLKNILNVEKMLSVVDGIREIKEFLIQNPAVTYTDSKYSNVKFLETNKL